jgi:hypothetical protein
MMIYRSKLYPFITHENVRSKFNECTRKIDIEVKRFQTNRENSKLKKVKCKYNYVGSFLKTKNTPIPILRLNDSEIILTDIDKAEHLAKFFESSFSSKTTNQYHILNLQINSY